MLTELRQDRRLEGEAGWGTRGLHRDDGGWGGARGDGTRHMGDICNLEEDNMCWLFAVGVVRGWEESKITSGDF